MKSMSEIIGPARAASRSMLSKGSERRVLMTRMHLAWLVSLMLTTYLLTGMSGAHADSFLHAQGPVAAAQRHHFWQVVTVMMVVVLPVFLLTPLIIWRYSYRRRGSARYAPKWNTSVRWELLLWGIPLLILIVLSPLLWQQTHRLDPYRPLGPAPLRIQVIGFDWKWFFIYPDLHIAAVGTLTLPANRPVTLSLTSNTVMQSFLVPALAGQIYAMPGMVTTLNLQADHPGRFIGENTQYNGNGFHAEHVVVNALPAAAFAEWVRSADAAPPLTLSIIALLRASGTDQKMRQTLALPEAAPLLFSAPPSCFFDQLVNVQMRPDAVALGAMAAMSSNASTLPHRRAGGACADRAREMP